MSEVPQLLPAVDVVGYVLADLAIILLAARLVGGLFVRLRQPRIVGEMVSGILVGPTVLGGTLAAGATLGGAPAVPGTGLTNTLYPAESAAFLNLFGVLALVLFTFLIGLEVPQHLLRGSGGRVTTIGVAAVLASIGLGFVLADMLDAPGLWRVAALPDGTAVPHTAHALLLGSGVTATALPVVARLLQDKNLLATPVGALGVGASAVVTPLTFLVIAAGSAVVAGAGATTETGVRLALTVVLVAVLLLVVRSALDRFLALDAARRQAPGGPLSP